MPTPYGAKFVKCPFYHRHDACKIVCEGLCKGNTINLVYEDEKDRRRYMNQKCNSIEGCQTCPIYDLLYYKWEGQ
jgi:hypothetical protein